MAKTNTSAPAKSSQKDKSAQPKADAEGRQSGGKERQFRTHNINSIHLELTAAQNPTLHQEGTEKEILRVYCIHNRWAGPNKPPHTLRISVFIAGRSLGLAKKTLAQGSIFVVDGELTGKPDPENKGRDNFSINANQITIIRSTKSDDKTENQENE